MSVDDAEAIFFQFGVQGASQMDKGELKSVWRHLAVKHHPDKGGGPNDMKYLNAAYDTLKNASEPDLGKSQHDPFHSVYGRPIQKKKDTGEMLEPVHGIFKNEYNNSTIAEGFYDFIDLVKIVKGLELQGVEISYDPLFPINPKTGQWLTRDLVIYCNLGSLNQIKKQAMLLYIRKLAKEYSTNPKKSA